MMSVVVALLVEDDISQILVDHHHYISVSQSKDDP